MDFNKLNSKDLIVRIRGDNCGWAEYGIISRIDNSLRYYPVNFYDRNPNYSYYGSNRWTGQAARAELGYPRNFKYRFHHNKLGLKREDIEDKIDDIINLNLENKVELYCKHCILPYVLSEWENRIWPIDIKYLNKKQKKSRKYFLKYGDFS